MAGQFRTDLAQLSAIAFDYGTHDQFAHIPLGCQALSRFLSDNGIGHRAETYDGDHFDHVRERLIAHALPFVSNALLDGSRRCRDGVLRGRGRNLRVPPPREIRRFQELERAHALLQEEHELLKKAIRFCSVERRTSSPSSRPRRTATR
jgi:transposase